MEYRRMGDTGLQVSVIGLGGNTFGRYTDVEGTTRIISVALDAGINFFDTADIYGKGTSEEHLGQALSCRRDQAIIATKAGMRMSDGPNGDGSSRAHIIASVHASLRRLRTDYIDLFQIHRFDPETPLEETLRALDDLVRSGAVRYIGCSNFDAWRMTQALWMSDRHHWSPFISNQVEYNLLARDVERELLPACQELGVGLIPYFPLAAGVLTGKYVAGQPAPAGTRGHNNPGFAGRLQPAALATVARLDAWARGRGHSVAELALAWLAARPAVATVIAGVTKPEQVTANIAAADWHMSAAEMDEVERLLTPGAEEPNN
ncbi:MAG TPA: aldo/keto reductase [Ktedonobacterales bacterium]